MRLSTVLTFYVGTFIIMLKYFQFHFCFLLCLCSSIAIDPAARYYPADNILCEANACLPEEASAAVVIC